MSHRPVRVRVAVALVATAALSATVLPAYAVPTDTDAARPAPAPSSPSWRTEQRAVAALDHARAVGEGRVRGDLTMALRAVANSRDALGGSDRAAADRLLARPGDTAGDGLIDWSGETVAEPVCSVSVCVHYVTTGSDRPPLTDNDRDDRPDFVESVLSTVTGVRGTYSDAGYRRPRTDGRRGGDQRFDVYLGDVGARGYYGYCIPDEPTTSSNRDRYDRYAYCGLDNDFSPSQFGDAHTRLENLQVTVAHEYFHATQYAYDAFEDSWLLEATAAWVEDEVYPAVDDNLQYLRVSPMTRPGVSLDTFSDSGFQYGTWSFFRFLTERYPTRQGSLPRLVLDVFRKADGAPGGDDDFSWKAVDRVLRAKGTSGAAMLGSYAGANRRATSSYAEGRANRYPSSPVLSHLRVGPTRAVEARTSLNHLTTATVRLTPVNLASTARLDLRLDLGARSRGSSAVLTVARTDGRLMTRRVALDAAGDARSVFSFSSASLDWVEVTLVNGSGRFRCFTDGAYSCQGSPLDQRQPARIVARAVR